MTKAERIRRYEAIIKWGVTSLDELYSQDADERNENIAFETALLQEYVNGLKDLKAQKDA